MMADFREIGPSFVLFAPRVWEALAAEVRAKVMDATPLKQRLFETGMRLGLQALEKGRRSALADALQWVFLATLPLIGAAVVVALLLREQPLRTESHVELPAELSGTG